MLCLDCVTDNNGDREMLDIRSYWMDNPSHECMRDSKRFVREQLEDYLRCPSRESEQYLIEAIRDHTQLSKH